MERPMAWNLTLQQEQAEVVKNPGKASQSKVGQGPFQGQHTIHEEIMLLNY